MNAHVKFQPVTNRSSPIRNNYTSKRPFEEDDQEDLCTLFIALQNVDPIIGNENTNLRFIEQQAKVTMVARNIQHAHQIVELNGTSKGIMDALLVIYSFLKSQPTSNSKKNEGVTFKILFDESLRGQVIGRDGQNIARVQNMRNFFCNVDNDKTYMVDNIDIKFAALNVMGDDMATGLPAALELMNPETENPAKRRKLEIAYGTPRYATRGTERITSTRELRPEYIRYTQDIPYTRTTSGSEFSTQYRPEEAYPHEFQSQRRKVQTQTTPFEVALHDSRVQRSARFDMEPVQRIISMQDRIYHTNRPRGGRSFSPERTTQHQTACIAIFHSLLSKANQNIFKADFISLLIKSKEIGSLIGKGGVIIKQVNARHNCFISITNNFGAYRIGCVSFKEEPETENFVNVLLDVAKRLTDDREDKTLRLCFPLPATKVDMPGQKKLKVDGFEVDVLEIHGQEDDLRGRLRGQVPLLRYMMNLVCHST